MKFFAVINTEIPLGITLNALGHMTLGLGHRLNGEPDIDVFFGNSKQVRNFRTLAVMLNKKKPENTAFSDFPNTMSGGNTDEQLLVGANTPESELIYFGSCFIGNTLDSSLEESILSCSRLSDYSPYLSEKKSQILSPQIAHEKIEDSKKIVMIINHKIPLAQTINHAVLCNLWVGKKAFSALRLVNIVDKDGNIHPNISYHPYPILKAQNPAKHFSIGETLSQSEELISKTMKSSEGHPLVSVAFGDRSLIDLAVPRKVTRLFDDKLQENDLVIPSLINQQAF